ncbi:MAG: MFS transporter [Quadrisphaera sp.]
MTDPAPAVRPDTTAGAPPSPSADEHRRLWRSGPFRRFWAAQAVSQLGDQITLLALPLLAITALDASATQVGMLTAAIWLPNLLGLALGTWTEQRTHKRRLLIAADIVRAAALASVPATALTGNLTLTQLYTVAVTCGAASVLFATAHGPFFVALVPRRQFLQANAHLSTTRSAAAIAGPAAGGALISAVSAPFAVLLDAASFLASAALLARTRAATAVPAAATDSAWRRAREGLVHVLRDRVLRASLGSVATANFFDYAAQAVLVLFASRVLGLSAATIGAVFAVGALGGLLGAVLAPHLSRRFGVGPTAIAGEVLAVAPLALAGLAHGPTWVVISMLTASQVLSNLGVMLNDINLNAIQTSVIPDHLRSRVTGAFTTINYGTRPLGALLGGLLADAAGARTVLAVAAIGGLGAVIWLVRSPIRRANTLDDLPIPKART